MADDWRPNETLSEERESQQPEQAQCKPLKESNNEKFDHEENSTDDWRRRPLNDTPSEGSLVATSNESGSTVSDADRERSSESSVISERYDDRTFEGEELDEGYEEKAINEADFEADEEFVDESYWNEILAKEAEQALQRSHISHPAFFLDDSTRFGPNVTVLSSTTSNDNLEFAIKTAAKTLERYANNQMLQARLIKKHCEEEFGTFWHCVTTSGNMTVFSRNEEHIHFVFKQTTIYLFRHEPYEPDAAHIKRMKNPDKTVMQIPLPSSDQCTIITNGMNLEKQQYAIRLAINALESIIGNNTDQSKNNDGEQMIARFAQQIAEGFEDVYGSHFHCFLTGADIGYHIRYDPDNNIVFKWNNWVVCLFKQNASDEDPFQSVHPIRERRHSGMLVPWVQPRREFVIKNGMNAAMLTAVIDIARKAVNENKSVEKIAHIVRTTFEAQHPGAYHCIVAKDHFGSYVHYDEKHYTRFVIDNYCFLLFRSQDLPIKDLRVTRYIPIGCASADIRVVSSGMSRPKERFAIDLAAEAIQRFVGDNMRAAKHLVERFEERHGSPYHCAMSESEMGFSVHHQAAMHFKIGSTAVLLFRNL